MDITSAAFWTALGLIIWTNVVLSGDNAVVIALAARSLPPTQQKRAIFWGSAAAIVLRILLTLVAIKLLQLPYLKIVGALLLFWIGTQLLVQEEEEVEDGKPPEPKGMMSAVRTILIADLVMSLDNVLAVAAAAKDSVLLLVLGLGISIPLIIFGSHHHARRCIARLSRRRDARHRPGGVAVAGRTGVAPDSLGIRHLGRRRRRRRGSASAPTHAGERQELKTVRATL
jgi:YjbE family integral membrane protein